MSITQTIRPAIEKFVASFKEAENHFAHSEIDKRVQNALARLENNPLPSKQQEAWKYSRIASWLKKTYRVSRNNAIIDISSRLLPNVEANVFVMVNGFFRDDLSMISYPQEGVIIQNMTAAYDLFPGIIENHFDHYTGHTFFSDLNTVYHGNGLFLKVDDNTLAEHPVHFIHIHTGAGVIAQPRNLVVVGKNSRITLTETHVELDANEGMTNLVSECIIEENAQLNYVLTQEGKDNALIHTLRFVQKDNSRLLANVFTLGKKFVRNDHAVTIDGKGCETFLNGAFMPGNGEQVDNHTLFDHLKPHCTSNELYKGILFAGSNAIFNGKIFVNREAQQINAFLNNANILLSDDAVMESKPELEIYADDVKCSHGSATGDIDEEAVFYLRARGIGKESARALLVHAFLEEVTGQINHSGIRESVSKLIKDQLIKRNL